MHPSQLYIRIYGLSVAVVFHSSSSELFAEEQQTTRYFWAFYHTSRHFAPVMSIELLYVATGSARQQCGARHVSICG